MINWVNRKRNKKGFTLIELIVVIAILGILAAIAVPRFSSLRATSQIKADASTAAQLISAARIQEAETGKAVTGRYVSTDANSLKPEYMTDPGDPQSIGTTGGATFVLAKHGTDGINKGKYFVTWTSANGTEDGKKIVIEGVPFDIKSVLATPPDA